MHQTRDLMLRHQRLIHASSQNDEAETDDTIRVRSQPSSITSPNPTTGRPQLSPYDEPLPSNPGFVTSIEHHGQDDTPSSDTNSYSMATDTEYIDNVARFATVDPIVDPMIDPMQDFTAFLENIGMSDNWFPDIPPSVESGLLPGDEVLISSLSHHHGLASGTQSNDHGPRSRIAILDEEPLSNFGSRMPSLQPEDRNSFSAALPASRPRSILAINTIDHQSFLHKISKFQHVLPAGFIPPSTYTLSRFLDGYLDGLNQHLPFIHSPTLSIASCTPALTLLLAACGSHYRFERTRGFQLFHAGRAILSELLRRSAFLEPSKESEASTQTSQDRIHESLHDESEDRIEVIQSLLLLTIFASWSHNPDILKKVVPLQGTLAHMVRTHGLQEARPRYQMRSDSDVENWISWARQERNRRTKLISYTFLNFHSTLHSTPPLILNSEIGLDLPCSTHLWAAGSPSEWRSIFDSVSHEPVPFQTSLNLLFSPEEESATRTVMSTPLGNHVLLHAIFQQLYFAKQLCRYPLLKTGLQLADLTTLKEVLRSWKSRWKETRESSTNPRNPAGPIAFTSVAMLGQVYVRLQVDSGPYCALQTNDPLEVARALITGPPIIRNSGLVTALLHAAHGLSIPIRYGIEYVARTYSIYLSVQHSFSALESAFLLTRWLLSLPLVGVSGMSKHEQKIFLWITHLMDETETPIKTPKENRLELVSDVDAMRRLGVGVVRVWATTFQGNTCWGLVDLIGASLKDYADLLEVSSR